VSCPINFSLGTENSVCRFIYDIGPQLLLGPDGGSGHVMVACHIFGCYGTCEYLSLCCFSNCPSVLFCILFVFQSERQFSNCPSVLFCFLFVFQSQLLVFKLPLSSVLFSLCFSESAAVFQTAPQFCFVFSLFFRVSCCSLPAQLHVVRTEISVT